MENIANILPWIQIGFSLLLMGLILLQQNDAGLGAAFGGGDGGDSTSFSKRGAEKTLFHVTIVVAVLFVLSAFGALLI